MRVFVILLLLASTAFAKPGDATLAIKQGNTRFRELVTKKADAAQFSTEMRTLFDIRELVKRAVVQHVNKMTAAELDDLVATLQTLVERNYVKQLRADLSYAIDYVGEEPQGQDVLVKTQIKPGGPGGRKASVEADYVLHEEHGKWRVYDVITDDVSMLRNYRSQFNKIIEKEGISGLLARMHKKLAEAT